MTKPLKQLAAHPPLVQGWGKIINDENENELSDENGLDCTGWQGSAEAIARAAIAKFRFKVNTYTRFRKCDLDPQLHLSSLCHRMHAMQVSQQQLAKHADEVAEDAVRSGVCLADADDNTCLKSHSSHSYSTCAQSEQDCDKSYYSTAMACCAVTCGTCKQLGEGISEPRFAHGAWSCSHHSATSTRAWEGCAVTTGKKSTVSVVWHKPKGSWVCQDVRSNAIAAMQAC